MSILCSSGGFSERQLQSVAVLLKSCLTSSLVFPEVDFRRCVHEGGCGGISPAAYEKRVQNMLVSVSEAALLRLRRCPTHSLPYVCLIPYPLI